jgi:radical SAM-linked protein
MRLRLRFEKTGAVRFASHKDVMRLFQRCLAACGVPVAYSEGYHPHMRMSFGPPLRTGWESRAEYLDLFVEKPAGDLAQTCNGFLPGGLRVTHVAALPADAPKLATDICAADYQVRVEGPEAAGAAARAAQAERRLAEETAAGPDQPRVLTLRAEADGEALRITYRTTMPSGKTVAPDAVVTALLGDTAGLAVPLEVTRLAQFVAREGTYLSPVDAGAIRKRI